MSQLVHIGTCGLHTLHSCMKHGEKAMFQLYQSCYHLCTEYLISQHLEELTMKHLHKQYLQTTHCCSVHIVGLKMSNESKRFGPKSLKLLTFGKDF